MDAPLDPPAAHRLGRYLLEQPIAEGGMGRVYRAVLEGPAGFRKTVALKVVRRPQEAARQALVNEARLGGLLKHPNIVEVYELGEADGDLFVAMELVDGLPVDELLVRAGRIPPLAVLDVGEQVCAALGHAHQLAVGGRRVGMVHRDVKPRNLLVDRFGIVKLADLGIALASGVTEGSWLARGTPGWLAPEQARGQAADARSDLFSLGLVLAELATGEPVIRRDDRAVHAVLGIAERVAELDLVARLDRFVPSLGAVLGRCLDEEPDRRFQTAGELADALHALRDRAPGPSLAGLLREMVAPRRRMHPGLSPTPTESSMELPVSNLGTEPDAFVGRQNELQQLRRALEAGARLVTLKGSGGAGKTRLARRLAREDVAKWPGGAWFADLSSAHDVVAALGSVASVLDARLIGEDPVERLGAELASRGRLLLVLDNLEQIADPMAAVVSRWLATAPRLVVLATSRHRLRLAVEQVVEIGPLSEPDAVRLLRLRARSPRWEAAPDEVLGAVVARLDGLPLAIELAAARARMLDPEALLARLDRRLELLAGHGRATQRQVIDWSWQLLDDHERAALAQLAVFEGGFTVEAAEEVVDLSPWPDAPWTLDVVESLWDKSLVRAEDGRFGLYETIRDFALERLREDGDEPATRRRHAACYAALASRADDELERLEPEIDNLRAAVSFALAANDATTATAAFGGLAVVLESRGPFAVGLGIANRLLVAPVDAAHRAAVRLARGRLLEQSGDAVGGEAVLREAVAGFVQAGDRRGEARARLALGRLLADQGRGAPDERQRQLEQAATAAREAGAHRTEALALGWLGSHLRDGRDRDGARRVQELGLDIARRCRDRRAEAWLVGELALIEPDRDLAAAQIESALATLRRVGDRFEEGRTLCKASAIYRAKGDVDAGLACDQRALDLCRALGDAVGEGIALESLALGYEMQGRLDDAHAAMADGLALRRRSGDQMGVAIHLLHVGRLQLAAGRLSPARAALVESAEMCDRIGLERIGVWSHLHLAEAELASGDVAAAMRRLDRVLSVSDAPLGVQALGRALLAVAHARRGERASADVEVGHAELLADAAGSVSATADVLWWLSLATRAMGDRSRADAYLDAARTKAHANAAAEAWLARREAAFR